MSVSQKNAYALGKRSTPKSAGVRLGKSNAGRKLSDETRAKISASNKGKPKSEAHKQALRKPKKKK